MTRSNQEKLDFIYDKLAAYPDVPDIGGGWLGRGMFGPTNEPAGKVDDTVGMLLNADGNAWNVVMIIGALLGVERDVQAIKDNALGKFPPGSYVADNDWLRTRAQEFAKKLAPLCGTLGPALTK
jgi:hypothetical protein